MAAPDAYVIVRVLEPIVDIDDTQGPLIVAVEKSVANDNDKFVLDLQQLIWNQTNTFLQQVHEKHKNSTLKQLIDKNPITWRSWTAREFVVPLAEMWNNILNTYQDIVKNVGQAAVLQLVDRTIHVAFDLAARLFRYNNNDVKSDLPDEFFNDSDTLVVGDNVATNLRLWLFVMLTKAERDKILNDTVKDATRRTKLEQKTWWKELQTSYKSDTFLSHWRSTFTHVGDPAIQNEFQPKSVTDVQIVLQTYVESLWLNQTVTGKKVSTIVVDQQYDNSIKAQFRDLQSGLPTMVCQTDLSTETSVTLSIDFYAEIVLSDAAQRAMTKTINQQSGWHVTLFADAYTPHDNPWPAVGTSTPLQSWIQSVQPVRAVRSTSTLRRLKFLHRTSDDARQLVRMTFSIDLPREELHSRILYPVLVLHEDARYHSNIMAIVKPTRLAPIEIFVDARCVRCGNRVNTNSPYDNRECRWVWSARDSLNKMPIRDFVTDAGTIFVQLTDQLLTQFSYVKTLHITTPKQKQMLDRDSTWLFEFANQVPEITEFKQAPGSDIKSYVAKILRTLLDVIERAPYGRALFMCELIVKYLVQHNRDGTARYLHYDALLMALQELRTRWDTFLQLLNVAVAKVNSVQYSAPSQLMHAKNMLNLQQAVSAWNRQTVERLWSYQLKPVLPPTDEHPTKVQVTLSNSPIAQQLGCIYAQEVAPRLIVGSHATVSRSAALAMISIIDKSTSSASPLQLVEDPFSLAFLYVTSSINPRDENAQERFACGGVQVPARYHGINKAPDWTSISSRNDLTVIDFKKFACGQVRYYPFTSTAGKQIRVAISLPMEVPLELSEPLTRLAQQIIQLLDGLQFQSNIAIWPLLDQVVHNIQKYNTQLLYASV